MKMKGVSEFSQIIIVHLYSQGAWIWNHLEVPPLYSPMQAFPERKDPRWVYVTPSCSSGPGLKNGGTASWAPASISPCFLAVDEMWPAASCSCCHDIPWWWSASPTNSKPQQTLPCWNDFSQASSHEQTSTQAKQGGVMNFHKIFEGTRTPVCKLTHRYPHGHFEKRNLCKLQILHFSSETQTLRDCLSVSLFPPLLPSLSPSSLSSSLPPSSYYVRTLLVTQSRRPIWASFSLENQNFLICRWNSWRQITLGGVIELKTLRAWVQNLSRSPPSLLLFSPSPSPHYNHPPVYNLM